MFKEVMAFSKKARKTLTASSTVASVQVPPVVPFHRPPFESDRTRPKPAKVNYMYTCTRTCTSKRVQYKHDHEHIF